MDTKKDKQEDSPKRYPICGCIDPEIHSFGYAGVNGCQKCGQAITGFQVQYKKGLKHEEGCKLGVEHLVKECLGCGFEWNEYCYDRSLKDN